MSRRFYVCLLVACVASVSCVGSFDASCGRVELDNPAMEVTASRVIRDCQCPQCAGPGEYQLVRASYVLEFWTGDRWYPELAVRARTADGHKLELRSPQLRSLWKTGFTTTITGGTEALPKDPRFGNMSKINDFDYWTEGVFNEIGKKDVIFHIPDRLDITVVNEKGNVLGKETVLLRLQVRHYRAHESL